MCLGQSTTRPDLIGRGPQLGCLEPALDLLMSGLPDVLDVGRPPVRHDRVLRGGEADLAGAHQEALRERQALEDYRKAMRDAADAVRSQVKRELGR